MIFYTKKKEKKNKVQNNEKLSSHVKAAQLAWK